MEFYTCMLYFAIDFSSSSCPKLDNISGVQFLKKSLESKIVDVLPHFLISATPCPPSYTQIGNTCYFFSKSFSTFDKSEMVCNMNGASIVDVTSKGKYKILTRQLPRDANYWIGKFAGS